MILTHLYAWSLTHLYAWILTHHTWVWIRPNILTHGIPVSKRVEKETSRRRDAHAARRLQKREKNKKIPRHGLTTLDSYGGEE